MNVRIQIGLIVAVFWIGLGWVQAQTVSVPDVTGLNAPQAAAELNRAGLELGAQTASGWTAASAFPAGTIGTQSIAPGENVSPGTPVDVTILSAANVRLIYDDNDLTLINDSSTPLDLSRLVFNSDNGTQRFMASRWRGSLDAGDCTQVWSINRGTAKDVAGCEAIFWLTTNNAQEHFWTQTAGVAQFDVVRDGVSLATCEAAPPNSQNAPRTCEFFVLSGTQTGPTTPYVTFVYTPDRFAVVNTSADAWMPLSNTPVQIPGLELRLSDPALFAGNIRIGDVGRMAPGQCSLLTLAPLSNAQTPEDCDLIAQNAVGQEQGFWTVPFDVLPATRPGERRTCPAATPDRVTLCIMPR